MRTHRFLASVSLITAAVLCSFAAHGQPYPSKSIRIITGTAGGATDLSSRIIAQGLTASLGQPVIVDNRGGGGIVAGPLIAKSPPDGYTLILYGSTIWLTPLLREDAAYDPTRDFAPITIVVNGVGVLVVHPSVPVTSVKELIALAKARPGALNYAATGSGSPNHLAAELFKSMARVNIVRINYKGAAPAINDVVAGQVQLTFATPVIATPHMKAKKLRGLAVASARPSTLVPDLPTIAASGVPGYESVTRDAMFAPAATPAAITRKLNQEVVRIMQQPDAKQKWASAGLEVVASTPEELAVMMQSELVKVGKLIKEAGIREE